ncbi:alpha/beta hydrolase [Niabella insulamsoli]|uniref:alpha/beta hydrolase n=1 Tax=Niabella insulamsoli TaxID=3144874 RepID=UPI0031FE427A
MMKIANAQQSIPLYDVVPNNKISASAETSETGADGVTRISKVSVPEMFMYQPEHPNGTAVLICPGGGYRILAISHEGHDVAKALTQWGITAFVLKYRLPDDETMLNKSIGPLQDAERAMQLIREHAGEWHINSKRVGVMGFSAGGHLAASLSTKYNQQLIENPKRTSFRPDFSVLVYPVISFADSITHMGSRDNLIGKKPSVEKIKSYSNELLVNKKTPPAFLVHARDDGGVPVANSMVYYNALLKHHVPAAIRYFDKGGHGFGMHNKKEAGEWMDDLKQWLTDRKLL